MGASVDTPSIVLVHEALDGLLSLLQHLNHVGVQQIDEQVGTEDGEQGSEGDSHGVGCCWSYCRGGAISGDH